MRMMLYYHGLMPRRRNEPEEEKNRGSAKNKPLPLGNIASEQAECGTVKGGDSNLPLCWNLRMVCLMRWSFSFARASSATR